MSVYGKHFPEDERWLRWARANAWPKPPKRGYSDVDVVDMVEVDGVWMTPEDARRAA